MAAQTRQRLIDAARRHFYRDGFRNVGIDSILADVGISKAAFYKHFESKEDLMVAVLNDVDHFLQEQFRAMVKERGGRSARGQLVAILDVVQQIIESDDFHGCIFVNAAMEFPLAHDPAHQAAAGHKRAIEEFVYELGERAGAKNPADLAAELCMAIEGAYVTRSVTGDRATYATAKRLAERIIAQHLPTADREVEPAGSPSRKK